MAGYRTLYRLRIEHDYFEELPCSALQCRFTPQAEALARRRGLLFIQTAGGEWTLLFQSTPVEGDTLSLDLSIVDPGFVLYTAWEGFHPSEAYELLLPQGEESIDAATVILSTGRKRGGGMGFCSISLRLTEAIIRKAESGTPIQSVLRFHSPSLQWEYLFIPTNGEQIAASGIQLEDASGRMEFSDIEDCEAYGRKAWRTVSKAPVPMCRSYGCRLRLTTQEGGKQKRVLLSNVEPPAPGRFMHRQSGVLRQVCCY